MAETLKGKGVVWGIDGITYTAGIVSATTEGKQQTARFARTSDKAEVRDDVGEVCAQIFYNAKRTLSVTVVPIGTGIAQARTAAAAWAPSPGTLVTVLDADTTLIGDNYNTISANINRTNTDACTVDLELEAYEAYEVATAPITS